MTIPITKPEALTFFCLTRQAERSIDFALSSERQWDLLRQYYDSARLDRLESAVLSLRGTPAQADPISGDRVYRIGVVWVLCYPVRILVNRFRASWHFRAAELQFIRQTLQAVLDFLKRRQKPEPKSLVQTRMDLHACQVITSRKLAGLPELRRAERVEHFCQAPHIQPFALEEIAGSGKEMARRISA